MTTSGLPARLATFSADGRKRFGIITDNGAINLHGRLDGQITGLRQLIQAGSLQPVIERFASASIDFSLGDISFDIPVADPEKIICVGVNFPNRNEEYKDGQDAPANPSLFIRFARSFVGHGENLVRPGASSQLDYEGEIVLVIGKAGRHISERDAFDHVAALSLCNEGTLRDWVRHAKFNVTQGKNFDSTGSIGPWLVPYTSEAQLTDIGLVTRVNGEVRQSDRTSRMIFGFRKLIAYISTFTTLVPGDVIVTGTPTGAGARFDPPRWLVPGDVIEVEADGIGVLRNGVADEVAP